MATDKKYCKECRDEIVGRRDKKFCSDYCRAQHFNTYNSEISNFMRRVNYTIRKNRKILSGLNPKGKAKAHKMKLIREGLNFDYFTNVYKTRGGKVYYFCYDQGYVELEDDYYGLVVKEDYVG
ncbi:MAG TPA: hypothetical protein VMZ69_10390 [Saprospiraceae bacterium]|nr:hypothetical protein [Saprospiraceae bacterium]